MIYIPDSKGQSFIEALLVVAFVTYTVLSLIKICKVVVDDMLANEAAFVAARSMAVTEVNKRFNEVVSKVEDYVVSFSQDEVFRRNNFDLLPFAFSTKKNVVQHLAKNYKDVGNDFDKTSNRLLRGNKSVTIWRGKKVSKDYSGEIITKETVKIYYSASLLSKHSKRYQAARNRIISSPDEKYYYKAFPGAKNFEE